MKRKPASKQDAVSTPRSIDQDPDLSAAFVALQAEEAKRVGSAEVAIGRARAMATEAPPPSAWRWSVRLAVLGAVASVALLLVARPSPELGPSAPTSASTSTLTSPPTSPLDPPRGAGRAFAAPGEWVMPSDVLLDLSALPGSRMMRGLDWSLDPETTSPEVGPSDLEGARSDGLPGREPFGSRRKIG